MRWCHGNHLKKRGVGMHLNHASDVSHAFINASVQTMSQMDGTWELPASDGAPHH